MFKTNSGGSVFTRPSSAKGIRERQDDSIRGIVTDDNSGDITIHLEQCRAAPSPQPVGDDLRRTRSSVHPQDTGNNSACIERPVCHHQSRYTQIPTMERNPNFHTVRDAGANEVPDAHVDKIVITQNGDESEQTTAAWNGTRSTLMDELPDADRLPEIGPSTAIDSGSKTASTSSASG